jgi:cytochrome c biogenesis protein CcmG, thiol:disulfide interchange protein DsbE
VKNPLFVHFRMLFFVICSFTAIQMTNAQQTLPRVAVTDIDGRPMSIDSIVGNGKITVISFWATWCAPCKKELDAIADVYEDWIKDYNVQLIAVSIDDARTSAKVKPMVGEKRWEYIVVLDANKDLNNALNVPNVPYTMLIDQNGNIVWTHSGYVPGGEEELEEKIAELRK